MILPSSGHQEHELEPPTFLPKGRDEMQPTPAAGDLGDGAGSREHIPSASEAPCFRLELQVLSQSTPNCAFA